MSRWSYSIILAAAGLDGVERILGRPVDGRAPVLAERFQSRDALLRANFLQHLAGGLLGREVLLLQDRQDVVLGGGTESLERLGGRFAQRSFLKRFGQGRGRPRVLQRGQSVDDLLLFLGE